MKDLIKVQAEEDFLRARNKALLNEIQNFLNPDRKKLLSFNDVKKILKPQGEVYAGMQTVPISRIVGSEGRYRDFDNHFFPRTNILKERWERVDEAHLADIILPPIQLYEIGGLYFVRDGNHRVSVAKAQGVHDIDAEVISLQSEIRIRDAESPESILKEVINYEKRVFYAETGFGDLTENWNLDFSSTGQYDVVYNHILVHKYFINEGLAEEIPFAQALSSWYAKVYQPAIQVIRDYRLHRRFRGRTESDLYVWIIKHWDDLKKKYGVAFPLDEAARDFKRRKPFGRVDYLRLWMKKIFQT